jgi:YihY family inner membrane protein
VAAQVTHAVSPRGLKVLTRLSARRFAEADGPSHSRAFAYHSMFLALSGFIGFLGLASVLDIEFLRATSQELVVGLTPGPSGRILQEAIRHGTTGGTAALLGLVAAVTTGTLAMAQFQRSANRILGIEGERPAVRRFLVALLLVFTSGVLLAGAALILAGGTAIAEGAGWGPDAVWGILRWPLGIVVAGLAILLLYRLAPLSRPGSRAAMLAGASAAIVLWLALTGVLALYFAVSDRSTQTYGPLVGIVALLLWTGLTSLALHVGFAVTAELAEERRDPDRTVTVPERAAARSVSG